MFSIKVLKDNHQIFATSTDMATVFNMYKDAKHLFIEYQGSFEVVKSTLRVASNGAIIGVDLHCI